MLRTSIGAAVGLALLAAAGCASTASEDPGVRPTRAAEFTSCPSLRLSEIPDGFKVSRRQLEALSDNHMGEVTTYADGKRSIKVYSGPDLYDSLEDLDLTADVVRTDEFEFELSSTLLQPELLIAVMDEEQFDEPCDSHGVLTRHVERAQMLELLAGLELHPSR